MKLGEFFFRRPGHEAVNAARDARSASTPKRAQDAPARPVGGSPGKAAVLVLALAAGPATASEVYWLDVVSYPAIPEWSQRHVQVLHTTESHDDGAPDTLGRAQQATRLTSREVKSLAGALLAWVDRDDPTVTIWSKTMQDATAKFWLDVVATPDQKVLVILTSMAILPPGRLCPSCYPEQAFTKQQMTLSVVEAGALADALLVWVGGEDPADGVIWSKYEEELP